MKTPGAQSQFATKNLRFVTTTGIPSHKLAESVCVQQQQHSETFEKNECQREKKQKEKADEREILRDAVYGSRVCVCRCHTDSPGIGDEMGA